MGTSIWDTQLSTLVLQVLQADSEMLRLYDRLTKAEASADSAVNRLQRLLPESQSNTEAARSEVSGAEAAGNRDAAEQELLRLQNQLAHFQAAAEELQRVHKSELAAQVLHNNIVE